MVGGYRGVREGLMKSEGKKKLAISKVPSLRTEKDKDIRSLLYHM